MRQGDGALRHPASVDQNLHTGIRGLVQGSREGGVQVMAGGEGVAVGALDHEQHDRPVARKSVV